jgi:hypothetical protein
MIEAVQILAQRRLLVVAHQKQREFDGPPWPLKKIDIFKEYGLASLLLRFTPKSQKSQTLAFVFCMRRWRILRDTTYQPPCTENTHF